MISFSGHTRQAVGTSATDTKSDTLPETAGFFVGCRPEGVAEWDSYPFKSLQKYPNEC